MKKKRRYLGPSVIQVLALILYNCVQTTRAQCTAEVVSLVATGPFSAPSLAAGTANTLTPGET